MLEARFGKKKILEAYLNEIYWGKSGPANVMGLGPPPGPTSASTRRSSRWPKPPPLPG